MSINKVCVIGAGVMGAGIAAHIANSKTSVLLLDIASETPDRKAITAAAKEKMTQKKMPQIAHPSLLGFIEIGNLDDDLEKITDCDLIIEVIVEKPEVKGSLYKKISPYIKPGAIMASNTSTLPLKELRSFLSPSMEKYFILTHFFNPPRFLPLLEIIYDERTSKEVVATVSEFITNKLGKTIVKSNDTPGFIANRLGCFLMELCLSTAYEKKVPINLIDYVFTKYLGFPSTGIFGLFDLIGLDVMQMISKVLKESLPTNDKFHKIYKQYDFYSKMLETNYKGRKGLGGFYRLKDDKKEVLDLTTMEYIESVKIDLPEGIDITDFFNTFAVEIKNIIVDFVLYAEELVGVISDSREDIDKAMKLGYGWKYGPFEMMSKLLSESPILLPNPVDTTQKPSIILHNASAFLYEAKPKNLVFSFKTKMNIMDEDVFNLLIESVKYAEKTSAEKLIIYTPGKHFSAGANLKLFLSMSRSGETNQAEQFLSLGQKAMKAVKYSKVPVISCAKGVALGGGCELLLHSHAVVAHLDLMAGLVEVGVGLIPGWGGLKEMVLRSGGNSEKLLENLKNIIVSTKSSSAYYFFETFSIANGHIVMNDNLLLEYALNHSFNAVHTDKNITTVSSKIDLISYLKDLKLDEHTNFIVKELQDAINSASLSEDNLLKIEKDIFKKLLVLSEAADKMQHVVV